MPDSDYMNREQQEFFRGLLQEMHAEILESIESFKKELSDLSNVNEADENDQIEQVLKARENVTKALDWMVSQNDLNERFSGAGLFLNAFNKDWSIRELLKL